MPSGLSGLQAGGATRGILRPGVAGSAVIPPMNTTNNLIPPIVQGALNPFLSAVSGLQNQWKQAVAPTQALTVNVQNPYDELRAKTLANQQKSAQGAVQSSQWQIDEVQRQLNALPTIGADAGAKRGALQDRLFGLQNTLSQAQQFSWGAPVPTPSNSPGRGSPAASRGWTMPMY